MRNRRVILAGSALLLLAMSVRHPTADIRVITHEASDPTPREVRAAFDVGLMAVSVLITWTSKRFA
ncbi:MULTISPECIES: hypothetical protein [unclassified Sphingomonas]|uniref:hypothetical protein n=1 Tax=unclassified Sphingomonas TaxID=196159 RepID=UPI000BD0D360|nr:MAG: hypothetical protein B7Z43_08930 [Sphingomonas sp. 12-62-6]OYX37265.1 MAG: hypothetical protein B7Y98_13345 [Sphingomonas sp. 32-62-10]OYY64872.1 MAG: hypothetical protein B7Y49_08085 [Sphingomonas sp. 28-62-11]